MKTSALLFLLGIFSLCVVSFGCTCTCDDDKPVDPIDPICDYPSWSCKGKSCYKLTPYGTDEPRAKYLCHLWGGKLLAIDNEDEFRWANWFLVRNRVDEAWVHSWNGDDYGRTCIKMVATGDYYDYYVNGEIGAIVAEDCWSSLQAICEIPKPYYCY